MAGVVDTTNTFITNQVITSTLMNNIIDNTFFASNAIADGSTTLSLVAGKLKVATSGITSNEIATNAVTNTAIAVNSITSGKIASNAVTTAKIADNNVTTAKILDANITTGKIANNAITPAKLNGGQTGSDPIYGIRAFARVESNGAITRNAGFATISRTGVGTYSLILTNTPSLSPVITATCHKGNGQNFSADVQINSSTSFTVRTGYEDITALDDSAFSVMVIY
jgi:hypothetical protein